MKIAIFPQEKIAFITRVIPFGWEEAMFQIFVLNDKR